MKEKFVVVKREQDVCISSEYFEINNMFVVTFSKSPNNFYKIENNINVGDKVEIIEERAPYIGIFMGIKHISKTIILVIEEKKILQPYSKITKSLLNLKNELKKLQNNNVLLCKINSCLYSKYPVDNKK